MTFLELKALTLRIGTRLLFSDLNLTVLENERWGLLGRNGAGKTTLLHSIIGLHPVESGSISINEKNIADTPRRELASTTGILFQEGISAVPATVIETVMLGRHPHVQSLLKDDAADIEIATNALRDLDLEDFSQRQVDTLSGGERQRLALAMLLAQTPKLFLLDEPSNHLDVAFQVKLLSVLEKRLSEHSASLLMATHDINLAARFCDKIILLTGNGSYVKGTRDEVLTEENLSTAYDCQIRSISGDGRKLFYPL